MAIDTVIFDLDGTLLYTLEDLTDSTNEVLKKYNYPLRTIDEIRDFVGNGVASLIEKAIPNGKNNPNYSDCLDSFKILYSQNMFNKTKPYDRVIDMLSKLKEDGYKSVVASNKFDSAVKKLCDKFFGGLIDYSVGQSDNISPKPASDMIIKAINDLNVTKEQCILVGDSEVDIQTADNLGIPCLSATWGYKSIDFLYKNGAGVFLYSPMDILDLI